MLLAIDTSSQNLSLALVQNGQVVDALDSPTGKQHGVMLPVQIQALLKQNQVQPQDLQGLAVGIGPGSYTGVRIGVTAAKMWAIARSCPLYQVSSLALMTSLIEPLAPGQWVIPLMDARRMSAYLGLYSWDTSGQIQPIIADGHFDWQEWMAHYQDQISQQSTITLLGYEIQDFAKAFREKFPQVDLQVLDQMTYLPSVRQVDKLVLTPVVEPHLLAPNYGQMTLAEREWMTKTGEDAMDHDHLVDTFLQ